MKFYHIHCCHSKSGAIYHTAYISIHVNVAESFVFSIRFYAKYLK